jgi:hypothetical protein
MLASRKAAEDRAEKVLKSGIDVTKVLSDSGQSIRFTSDGGMEYTDRSGVIKKAGGTLSKGSNNGVTSGASAISTMHAGDGFWTDNPNVDFVQKVNDVLSGEIPEGLTKEDLRKALNDDLAVLSYANKWSVGTLREEMIERARLLKTKEVEANKLGINLPDLLENYKKALSDVPPTFQEYARKAGEDTKSLLALPTTYQTRPTSVKDIDSFYQGLDAVTGERRGRLEGGNDAYYNDLLKAGGFSEPKVASAEVLSPGVLPPPKTASGTPVTPKIESYTRSMPQDKEQYNKALQNVLTDPNISQEERVVAIKALQSFASDPKNFGKVTMSTAEQEKTKKAIEEENRVRPIMAAKSAQELVEGKREPSDFLGIETYKTDREGKVVIDATGYPVRDTEAEKAKADVIGLSAIMTTTMPSQREVIEVLKERGRTLY